MIASMGTPWYAETISLFLSSPVDTIIGQLSSAAEGSLEKEQITAWRGQTEILKETVRQ